LVLDAAREAFHENERAISLAKAQGENKLPDAPATAQTLLIDTLLQMDNRRFQKHKTSEPFSVTAYHLTNSGQTSPLDEKSPPVKIYHLPMDIVGFLLMFNHPDYREAWKELVKRGWELPKPSKGVLESSTSPSSERRRNYLYEDIIRLPENARTFVRMYLLRIPKRNSTQVDPRRDYNTRKEIDLVSWQLTDLFLRKVMHMDKERIEEIRKLGDRLATYVEVQNDKRFFLNFYRMKRYDDFRSLLTRANYKYVKSGKAPLVEFKPYLTVFEEGYEVMRPDWTFARDLVLICLIESLYKRHWFSDNPDALPDDKEIDTELVESEL
jgi:CRISPR-associated protein Cst1